MFTTCVCASCDADILPLFSSAGRASIYLSSLDVRLLVGRCLHLQQRDKNLKEKEVI